MKEIKIDIGEVFNALTVLDMQSVVRGKKSPRREIQLLCRCSFCGSKKWYPKASVINGRTKSCGCSKSKQTHGEWHTRLYGIWSGMKRRCYVTTCKAYKYYGARGIKVCDEWHTYVPFRDWALSHGYTDKLTIDRIDVNGNYCPENCRWATYVEQQNNRRNNHIVIYNGEKWTVAELARAHGISSSMLNARLRKGEPLETALVKEDRRGGATIGYAPVHEARGESHTTREWAMIIGCDAKKLSQKMSQQLHFEHALDLAEWGVYQKKSGKISFREWFKLKYDKDYSF